MSCHLQPTTWRDLNCLRSRKWQRGTVLLVYKKRSRLFIIMPFSSHWQTCSVSLNPFSFVWYPISRFQLFDVTKMIMDIYSGVYRISRKGRDTNSSSGGSRISLRWGPQLSEGGGGAPTYDFAKISQKMHEIERIWTLGGVSKILLCRSATV